MSRIEIIARMNREILKEHLVLAEKHIAEGTEHVERQRRIVEELVGDGKDPGNGTASSVSLLRTSRPPN